MQNPDLLTCSFLFLFLLQRDLEMRCHQLEQELQLSFERKVQETRLFESEKGSLERRLEQEKGFRFISAGLLAFVASQGNALKLEDCEVS